MIVLWFELYFWSAFHWPVRLDSFPQPLERLHLCGVIMRPFLFLSALYLLAVSQAQRGFRSEQDRSLWVVPRAIAEIPAYSPLHLHRRGKKLPAAPSSPTAKPNSSGRSSTPPPRPRPFAATRAPASEAESARIFRNTPNNYISSTSGARIHGQSAKTETGQHLFHASVRLGHNSGEPRQRAQRPNRKHAMTTASGKVAEKNKKAEEAARGTKLVKDEKGFSSDKPKLGEPSPHVTNVRAKEQQSAKLSLRSFDEAWL